ncbi:14470_t:CDS:2, partial [Funneliformis caledonium]
PEQANLSDDEEGSQSFDNESTSDDEPFLNNDEMFAIFKYQERFRLSDITINSLIGFFSLVLKDIDLHQFKDFPPTAYKAKKLLEIKKPTKTFATCPH